MYHKRSKKRKLCDMKILYFQFRSRYLENKFCLRTLSNLLSNPNFESEYKTKRTRVSNLRIPAVLRSASENLGMEEIVDRSDSEYLR